MVQKPLLFCNASGFIGIPSLSIPTNRNISIKGLYKGSDIVEDIILPPLGRALVPTGIAIEIPGPEYGAFLYARSGLAIKKGITLANCVGVIDSDYTGEIKVGLINLSNDEYVVQNGERIAQLVIMPVNQANLVVVDELDKTERGAGGFGSTGMN